MQKPRRKKKKIQAEKKMDLKKVIKRDKRKVFAKQLYLSTKRCKHKSFNIA